MDGRARARARAHEPGRADDVARDRRARGMRRAGALGGGRSRREADDDAVRGRGRGHGCAQRRARDRKGEHGDAEQAAGNERDHPEASGGSNPQYRQTLDRA